MNLFTYIKIKWNDYWHWFKRKMYGDMRPVAVRPEPKKRTTKRKTK